MEWIRSVWSLAQDYQRVLFYCEMKYIKECGFQRFLCQDLSVFRCQSHKSMYKSIGHYTVDSND